LPEYEITGIEETGGMVRIRRSIGAVRSVRIAAATGGVCGGGVRGERAMKAGERGRSDGAWVREGLLAALSGQSAPAAGHRAVPQKRLHRELVRRLSAAPNGSGAHSPRVLGLERPDPGKSRGRPGRACPSTQQGRFCCAPGTLGWHSAGRLPGFLGKIELLQLNQGNSRRRIPDGAARKGLARCKTARHRDTREGATGPAANRERDRRLNRSSAIGLC